MVAPITSIAVNRGLCPHGLPFAACPICSGKSGGASAAGGSSKEMTWDECYAVGQRLKAEAQRTQDANRYNADTLALALQSNKTYQAIAARVAIIADFMQRNFVAPISNFLSNVVNFVTRPIINFVNSILNSPMVMAMKQVAANIQKGFSNICDKLAAVIGEPMMAVAQFAAEVWNKLTPKKFLFFAPVDTEMEQGEQEEEVELKRWLHLGSLKKHIDKLFKKDSDKGSIKW